MGDIVLTAPALRGLRRTFPRAELVFITTHPYAELAAALPEIDKIEEVRKTGSEFLQDVKRLAEQRWDRIADLQDSLKSARLTAKLRAKEKVVDSPPRIRRALLITIRLKVGHFLPVPRRYLQALKPWGVMDDDGGLELHLLESLVEETSQRWKILTERPYVFIPGAKHATKQWLPNYWGELARKLIKSAPIVLLGEKGEVDDEMFDKLRGIDGVYDLTGETSILQAAAIIKFARAAVTGDTGPMHLAVAMKVPLVVIFGPTVKEFGFFPFRADNAVVLEKPLWCRPCSPHGSASCPLRHHNCMTKITPEEVFDTIRCL